jgi:hypothetical protein
VALGDRDDQAQVRLHEGAPRRIAVPDPAAQLTAVRCRCRLTVKLLARLDAGFDALGEPDLVVFAQQGMAPNVVEIQLNEVLPVVRGVARCGHERFPYRPPRTAA